jgi:hypothetical protein
MIVTSTTSAITFVMMFRHLKAMMQSFYQPSVNYSVVNSLLTDNNIGSCKADARVVSDCSVPLLSQTEYLFTICKPTDAEVLQYQSVPGIYTMANPELAVSIGKPLIQ